MVINNNKKAVAISEKKKDPSLGFEKIGSIAFL